MKKNSYITYASLIVFHISVFIMTLYVDHVTSIQDLGSLFTISKWAFIFKYFSFIGLGLIIYNFVLNYLSIKSSKLENGRLNQELNTLKAKLFDLQEAAKKTGSVNPTGKS